MAINVMCDGKFCTHCSVHQSIGEENEFPLDVPEVILVCLIISNVLSVTVLSVWA